MSFKNGSSLCVYFSSFYLKIRALLQCVFALHFDDFVLTVYFGNNTKNKKAGVMCHVVIRVLHVSHYICVCELKCWRKPE